MVMMTSSRINHILLIIFSCSTISLFSQDWVKRMNDPSVNFYEVQKAFNDHWSKEERKEKLRSFFSFKKEEDEENEGFTMYKRWENFVAPRVYPSGDRSVLLHTAQELEKMVNSTQERSRMMAGGNWHPLGATSVPTGGGGAGRVNGIRFHPVNHFVWFACTPAGGLWKSTDAGATWHTATDQLPTLGVSDVAVDPVDPNVMYIGTGDNDASDTKGIGVLKSTDGGNTWGSTGLNFLITQGRYVSRVMIQPGTHTTVFAATSVGLFRSTNSGMTWIRVLSTTNVKDMEFKPGDPSVVYACSATGFYRSTDFGSTFTLITSGLPAAATVNRLAIAVTPAANNYVYLVYSSTSSNFKGLYRSMDGGQTFSLQSDAPNLLGYDANGMDSGGQGWYTLSIAASPLDPEEVAVGGVNVWRSNDGGSSWNILSHWYGAGGLPYVHADVHDLCYQPGTGELFATCDGGIFSTNDGGTSFQDLSSGMQIGEMYRLGGAATDPDKVMQGWQDNGCNLYNAGSWSRILGGDGMETFIDWSDANVIYGESQYGGLSRSTNGGITFSGIGGGISEAGEWVTPWLQDPVIPTTIYAGFKNVWKSTNMGTSWTQISSFNSTGLTSLVVAPSDPNYIYASTASGLYRTMDGGSTWTTVPVPFSGTATISYLAVSAADAHELWMSRSGYSSGLKVFQSKDAGATWTNISGDLPNIPVNCIVNQTGTNDGVYVGTDLGVFYHDNDLGGWMPYNNGLPNVIVDELEIHYGSGKLRAATYGRGLWETDIYNPASPRPFANFKADSLSGCVGLTVQFSDTTKNNPTSWQWYFPGGTPDTSSLQNPVVTYLVPGSFNNVKLVTSNGFGSDSITKLSYITVSPMVKPILTLNNNDSLCQGQAVNIASNFGYLYHWYPTNQTGPAINVSTTGEYAVTVTDAYHCPVTSDTQSVYVFPLPVAVIVQSGDTLFSNAASGNQWYLNGSPIPGATDSLYVMQSPGTYSVLVTADSSGCSSVSNQLVGIEESEFNGATLALFPNPVSDQLNIQFNGIKNNPIQLTLLDEEGHTVMKYTLHPTFASEKIELDLRRFSSGNYLLELEQGTTRTGKKIIVKH